MAAMIMEPLSERFGVRIHNPGGESLLDLDTSELIELFRTSVAVLFEGYSESLEVFEEFSGRFCSSWLNYAGGAFDKRVANPGRGSDIYSVNKYSTEDRQVTFPLEWHADMSYIKKRPTCLFFYMVQPAESGGESGLCDGALVYQGLSPRTRALFERQRIKYIRTYADGDWQIRFYTDDLDLVQRFCAENDLALSIDRKTSTLKTEYTTSAIRASRWGGHKVFNNSILLVLWQEALGKDNSLVRMEDGSPIPADVVQELKDLIEELKVVVPLKKSQVMWIDNTRALHKRLPFRDPARNLVQRMAGEITW
jgi:alpha-ketoglutarate-dependent taurine dioxygenase